MNLSTPKTALKKAALAFCFSLCSLNLARATSFSYGGDSYGGGYAVTGQSENKGYAYQLYNATNGLPTSDANTILASRDGFIWIGGYSGLIRYDGTSFVRQDFSDGITNANTLYEDSKGRLWIGMNENGVVVVDKGSRRRFSYAQGFRSATVRSITEAQDGTIYIGTTQGIMYIDRAMQVNALDDQNLNTAYVIRLVSAADGAVYGNTRSGDLFCIKNRVVQYFYTGEALGVNEVTTVYPDPKEAGALYLGTDSAAIYRGRITEDGFSLEKITVTPASYIKWITYASDRIWLSSETVAGYLDENNTYHVLENLPFTSAIGEIIEDYEGNIWITSFRYGVVKLVANQFTNLSAQAGLESVVVNATCLHNGLLYIGTDRGLQILSLDGKAVHSSLTDYIGSARIRCIMSDGAGNLWLSTYNQRKGLVCLTASGRITSYTEANGLLSNETRCTALTADGAVLVATNNGLNVLKDGAITASYDASAGILHTMVLTVCAGSGGSEYYIGTDGGGIYIIDGNKVIHKGRTDGLMSEVVMRIKYDEKRDVYWIVTSNSLAYMKDEKITTIRQFPYPNNYDIYYDTDDNLWILASNGIYVAKAYDVLKNGKIDVLFYDTTSGLSSIPTGNAFSALDSNGNLYLACRSGVSSVNINRYFEKTHDIKLSVPYIEADEKRYYVDESGSVTLPVTTKTVTIYGYALTYALQNPKIQYYLSGFDKEPIRVTKKNMEPVRYTNLHGGTYTYELSLLNNSTNQVQQTLTLKITKEKRLYERVWFWIFAFIVFTLVLCFFAQLCIGGRIRKMRQKAENDRIFTNAIIGAFANCVDGKDKYTNGHSARVAKYTRMLAERLGEDHATVEKYYNIALLHDIGKISVPDAILKKPGKLDDEEFAIMKSHAQRGYEILKDVTIQEDLAAGAHYHHERFDGKGYPDGLSGESIPYVARIIAVADTFDAMSSTRPYRKQLPLDYIVEEIQRCSGTQFDPAVVDKFMELYHDGAFDEFKS